MRAILDMQWDTMQQQKQMLRDMTSHMQELRQQLAKADHGKKFCNIALSPLSKASTYTQDSSSSPRCERSNTDMSSDNAI